MQPVQMYINTLLDKIILRCEHYQGIGAGAGVDVSGERTVFRNWIQRISCTPLIFDVGANVGKYAAMVLEIMGSNPVVIHCFEPSRETFLALEKHPALSGNSSVILNPFACGRVAETRTLYSDETCSGLASMTKRRLNHYGIEMARTEEIKVIPLDAYCIEKKITTIDFLKMDVEGHEMDVLAGAATLFSQQAIRAVQFEFGGCNIDTRTYFQDFFYFFSEYGYTIHRITASGWLYPIPVYNEILERFRTTNFLAIANG